MKVKLVVHLLALLSPTVAVAQEQILLAHRQHHHLSQDQVEEELSSLELQ